MKVYRLLIKHNFFMIVSLDNLTIILTNMNTKKLAKHEFEDENFEVNMVQVNIDFYATKGLTLAENLTFIIGQAIIWKFRSVQNPWKYISHQARPEKKKEV